MTAKHGAAITDATFSDNSGTPAPSAHQHTSELAQFLPALNLSHSLYIFVSPQPSCRVQRIVSIRFTTTNPGLNSSSHFPQFRDKLNQTGDPKIVRTGMFKKRHRLPEILSPPHMWKNQILYLEEAVSQFVQRSGTMQGLYQPQLPH